MDYGKVREVNSLILEKYNDHENELKFYDYFLFHMTSMALSVFREHLLNNTRISISQAFLIRSIIEDIAIMNMYDRKEVTEDADYLITGHAYLVERDIYKHYPNLDGIDFTFEKMEENFFAVNEAYREVFGSEMKSKDFKRIINSQLPFLEKVEKFHSLIEKYCPDLLYLYQYLSVIIHPAEIETSICELNIDICKDYLQVMFESVAREIELYYPDIVVSPEHFWQNEVDYCFGSEQSGYSPLVEYSRPQIECLFSIASYIQKDLKIPDDDCCHPQVFFYRLAEELESVAFDKIFGFSEVLKSKIKPIYEYCATFYHSLDTEKGDAYIEMMKTHTIVNAKKVKNEDYSKTMEDYYLRYKYFMNEDISFNDYKDRLLKLNLPVFIGFKSINDFVYSMIDDITSDNLFKKDTCKMLYEESQALSHGNGYMLASNFGAFMDSKAASRTIDLIIGELIGLLIIKIETSSKQHPEIGNFNKLLYDLKRLKKQYIIIIAEKTVQEEIILPEKAVHIG